MSDLWTIALEVLAEFGRSDVVGHAPHWAYCWLATSGAHIGMGMGLALGLIWWPEARALVFRAWLPVGLLGVWAFKELIFDLPNGDYSLLTWAGSAADLAFGALGFWFAQRSLRRARESAFLNAGKTTP